MTGVMLILEFKLDRMRDEPYELNISFCVYLYQLWK